MQPGPDPDGRGSVSHSLHHPPAPRPPSRPLVRIAFALAISDSAGVAWSQRGFPGPDRPLLAGLALAVVVAVGSAGRLATGCPRVAATAPRARTGHPRVHGLLPLVGLCTLCFLRSAVQPVTPCGEFIAVSSGEARIQDGPHGSPPLRFPAGVARIGDRIRPAAAPRPWMSARAPGADKSIERGVLSLEELMRYPAPPTSTASSWLDGLRSRTLRRMKEIEDPAARGLGLALLCGDRSELPSGLPDLFTRTGTRHLLAVSGLHVGLLSWLILGRVARILAHPFRRSRFVVEALLGSVLFLVLIPLTGGGASVRRAAIAAAIAHLAPLIPGGHAGAGRRTDGLSLWGLALAIEISTTPGSSTDLGLRLSYAATFGLLLLHTILARKRCSGFRPAERVRGLDRRPVIPMVALRWMKMGLAASLAATVATLPFTWSTFGEVSLPGPLATPLCLGPLIILLATSLAWAVLGMASLPWMDTGVALAQQSASEGLLALLQALDQLPGTPVPLPPRPLPWLLVVVSALALGLASRSQKVLRSGLGAAGLTLLPWTTAPQGLEIVACDVGHGTAVAVRAPGRPIVVFDGGSRDRGGVATRALGPLLRGWDASRVVFVLSHDHKDHAGALPWLSQRWKPLLWLGSSMDSAIGGQSSIAARRLDLEPGTARLVLGGDLELEVGRGGSSKGNEGSRHLRIRWLGREVLLLGDAVEDGLAECLEHGTLDGPVDLLLLPHHGGASPHLGELLEKTRPALAWASCSRPPAGATVTARAGVPLRTTLESGPLRALFRAAAEPAIR